MAAATVAARLAPPEKPAQATGHGLVCGQVREKKSRTLPSMAQPHLIVSVSVSTRGPSPAKTTQPDWKATLVYWRIAPIDEPPLGTLITNMGHGFRKSKPGGTARAPVANRKFW